MFAQVKNEVLAVFAQSRCSATPMWHRWKLASKWNAQRFTRTASLTCADASSSEGTAQHHSLDTILQCQVLSKPRNMGKTGRFGDVNVYQDSGVRPKMHDI